MQRAGIIAFGANLGDTHETFANARAALEDRCRCALKPSSLYVTAPLVPPGQKVDGHPDYLNAAFRVETERAAEELIEILLDVERSLGRVRGVNSERWAPRKIDLDLIALGDLTIRQPHLILPHPRMAERDFVLLPFAELAPEWRHPMTGHSAWDMLDALKARGAPHFVRKVHPFGNFQD